MSTAGVEILLYRVIHFFRTDTITQAEERRRREEAERARAEFLAKAGTVAAVLAIGGIAVLCGVDASQFWLDVQ